MNVMRIFETAVGVDWHCPSTRYCGGSAFAVVICCMCTSLKGSSFFFVFASFAIFVVAVILISVDIDARFGCFMVLLTHSAAFLGLLIH